MEIRVLGAHNVESSTTKMTSLLIDGTLAVDAGALTSSLSFEEQEKVSAVLLTHCHYDHLRDVAALTLNFSYFQKTANIYAQPHTIKAISDHILNGVIYPRFNEIPTPDNPPVTFHPLQPGKEQDVAGYRVLALPVKHAVPTVAFQISSPQGKSIFFSGDTGPGLSDCWEHISPQLLMIDVTMPNRLEKHAISSGHLTPRLLSEELRRFKETRGYLPPVVLIHLSPLFEPEMKEEAEQVASELDVEITLSYEGMKLSL